MNKKSILMPDFLKRNGLVIVVVQDVNTLEVLMVAYTNREGFLETLKTGESVFYSTSRKKKWKKGETSGNTQVVCKIKIDCDRDTLIYFVKSKGPACHTGKQSCFYRSVIGASLEAEHANQVEIHEVSNSLA
jgi:phosphoribosyl-AMP cyclohydrolase